MSTFYLKTNKDIKAGRLIIRSLVATDGAYITAKSVLKYMGWKFNENSLNESLMRVIFRNIFKFCRLESAIIEKDKVVTLNSQETSIIML